jgi:hypothetical protein
MSAIWLIGRDLALNLPSDSQIEVIIFKPRTTDRGVFSIDPASLDLAMQHIFARLSLSTLTNAAGQLSKIFWRDTILRRTEECASLQKVLLS